MIKKLEKDDDRQLGRAIVNGKKLVGNFVPEKFHIQIHLLPSGILKDHGC